MADAPKTDAGARARRRWLTLGETIALAAVAISGLTFWNSYRERTDAESARIAGERSSTRTAQTLVLKATADKDGSRLALVPRLDTQLVQGQTLTFPTALGLSPVETTGDARIERDWVQSGLVKARKTAGAKDETAGDARLPVMIETRFLVDGEPHTDRAIYDLGYATDHGFLSGTTVRLRGLSRVGSVSSVAEGRKRIDALAKAALG